MLDPLHQMNEDWVGAGYEFHDTKLQAAFAEVHRLAHELGSLVLERIFSMNGNPNMGWPKTNMDVAKGVQQSTLEAIRAMNERASQFSTALDAFDRVARERIRVGAVAS